MLVRKYGCFDLLDLFYLFFLNMIVLIMIGLTDYRYFSGLTYLMIFVGWLVLAFQESLPVLVTGIPEIQTSVKCGDCDESLSR